MQPAKKSGITPNVSRIHLLELTHRVPQLRDVNGQYIMSLKERKDFLRNCPFVSEKQHIKEPLASKIGVVTLLALRTAKLI